MLQGQIISLKVKEQYGSNTHVFKTGMAINKN